MIKAYAFKWSDGEIDVEMISYDKDRLKNEVLRETLGWRYDYEDLDKNWNWLIGRGCEIVEVEIHVTDNS